MASHYLVELAVALREARADRKNARENSWRRCRVCVWSFEA